MSAKFKNKKCVEIHFSLHLYNYGDVDVMIETYAVLLEENTWDFIVLNVEFGDIQDHEIGILEAKAEHLLKELYGSTAKVNKVHYLI